MTFEFKYRKAAQALYLALVDDAFYKAMEASVNDGDSADSKKAMSKEAISIEAMFRYMDYSMIEAQKYGMLDLIDDNETGAVIWSRPLDQRIEVRRSEEKKSFLYHFMGQKSLETYLAIGDFMSSKTESIIDDRFWYLSIVGIHPDSQGKGLGRLLIEKQLQSADKLQIPTFLETFTPRNMSFYNRLGYKSVASFFEPTTNAEYWIMIRDPA